jgi:hypothetical protein
MDSVTSRLGDEGGFSRHFSRHETCAPRRCDGGVGRTESERGDAFLEKVLSHAGDPWHFGMPRAITMMLVADISCVSPGTLGKGFHRRGILEGVMNERSIFRDASTATVAIANGIFLSWQHFHDGVPSHHFFDRADMPAISNGWGGLLLPLMTWFLIGRVQKRVAEHGEASKRYAVVGFMAALLFGISLSVFFTLGDEQVSNAMFESLFAIALFVPIYRPEYLLGLVLGMAYTFGGVLPSIVGSVVAIITLLIYRYVRGGALRVGRLMGMAKHA